MLLMDITRADITFYLGTVATILLIIGIFWKATVGGTLKRMQDDAVTKLDLATKLGEMKDFLRENFVSRKEFETRVAERRTKSRE